MKTKEQVKTKFAIDELIRIKAQLDVLEDEKKKQEQILKDAHPHHAGTAVTIRRVPHTLSYLWVTYKEGVPHITENYSKDPVVSDDGKEFVSWSPISPKPEEITYLDPLTEDERERLIELNEMYDFGNVDSRTEVKELESERDELRARCGHKWKDTSPLFADWGRQYCEKCNWEMRTDD